MQLLLEIYRGELESANLTKLPAMISMCEETYLINKDEVFIADDLQPKKIFSSFDKAPLFDRMVSQEQLLVISSSNKTL